VRKHTYVQRFNAPERISRSAGSPGHNLLWLAPVPVVTGLIMLWLYRSLTRGGEVAPFIGALGLFLMCYLG